MRSLLTALSFYIWSDYVNLFAHCLCIFKFRIINYPWGNASGKNWRAIKLLKILPHLVDTLLIASGLTIFFLVGYQLQSWLVMKIIMLVLYIFFSAKYFSRKAVNPNSAFLAFALLSFLGAMFFAYQPNFMEG